MTEREELAYLAGVLDSDGSIMIHQRCRQRAPGSCTRNDVRLVISVAQMRPEAVKLFQEHFGGNICRERTHNLYKWQACCRKAAHVVQTIAPYLRLKRTQAWLAQEFLAQRGKRYGGKPLTAEEKALRVGFALAMQTANREYL